MNFILSKTSYSYAKHNAKYDNQVFTVFHVYPPHHIFAMMLKGMIELPYFS
jgi:hypothetical protein